LRVPQPQDWHIRRAFPRHRPPHTDPPTEISGL